MAFIKVKSSQIHSISYSPEDETLEVKFNCSTCQAGAADSCPKCGGSGASSHYRYKGVPQAKYVEIRDADSVGSAFHRLVKSQAAAHPYERVR